MISTHIRVPVDVKKMLEERAGSRPLGEMLREDFLGEPDIMKLLDIRFKSLEVAMRNIVKIFEHNTRLLQADIRKYSEIILDLSYVVCQLPGGQSAYDSLMDAKRRQAEYDEANMEKYPITDNPNFIPEDEG